MTSRKELVIIADDEGDARHLAYVLRTRGRWMPCILPHGTPRDPACIVVLCRYSMDRVFSLAKTAKRQWPRSPMLYVVRENEGRLRGHELIPERIMHRPTVEDQIEAITVLSRKKHGPKPARSIELEEVAASCA